MEIKQIDFNNEGDLILQATATSRFKILSKLSCSRTKDGYEIAEIQIIEDGPDEEETFSNENLSSAIAHEPTTSQLINIARDFIHGNEFVALMLYLHDLPPSLDVVPENAADFSFYVASLLPIREEEKYELLEKRSIKERMQLVVKWIDDFRSRWGVVIINYTQKIMNIYVLYWMVVFFRWLMLFFRL